MIIIRPVTINDSVLTASDVPETDYSEWLIGSAYVTGNTTQVTDDLIHSVYEALGATTGDYPPDNPDKWLRISATNTWAMFSDQISDTTDKAVLIDVTLTPAAVVNAISFFGLDGTDVVVEMDDPIDGIVYSNTIELTDATESINNWWSYYFEPVTRQSDLVLLDLPPYSDADINITINNASGTASCGLVSIGTQQVIGTANHGTGVGIIDYSRKELDSFGRPVITQRNFSKRASYDVSIPTDQVSSVQSTLAALRTTPMTWIGDPNNASTVVYGYYRDFDIIIASPTLSSSTIDVEGLT